MYSQSELDNSKLQMELLQEKLRRSEESRHQLEDKLEHIMQKRTDREKAIRSKIRQKYQQFLDEQKRRNDRNKQLVQLLERIDQQSTAMSARSERLKMMKIQYEMYFAKLVQSQTMRSIQLAAQPLHYPPPLSTLPPPPPPSLAPSTAIPILVHPTGETQTSGAAAINHDNAGIVGPNFNRIDGSLMQTAYACVTPHLHSTIAVGGIPTEPHGQQYHWALAMAPPTKHPAARMFLTGTHPTAAKEFSNFDYVKFPIGYLQSSTAGTAVPVHFGGQSSSLRSGQDFIRSVVVDDTKKSSLYDKYDGENGNRSSGKAKIVEMNDSVASPSGLDGSKGEVIMANFVKDFKSLLPPWQENLDNSHKRIELDVENENGIEDDDDDDNDGLVRNNELRCGDGRYDSNISSQKDRQRVFQDSTLGMSLDKLPLNNKLNVNTEPTLPIVEPSTGRAGRPVDLTAKRADIITSPNESEKSPPINSRGRTTDYNNPDANTDTIREDLRRQKIDMMPHSSTSVKHREYEYEKIVEEKAGLNRTCGSADIDVLPHSRLSPAKGSTNNPGDNYNNSSSSNRKFNSSTMGDSVVSPAKNTTDGKEIANRTARTTGGGSDIINVDGNASGINNQDEVEERIDPNNRNGISSMTIPAPATSHTSLHGTAASPSSYRPKQFDKKEKMSMEKIENVIYGELVNPLEEASQEERRDPDGFMEMVLLPATDNIGQKYAGESAATEVIAEEPLEQITATKENQDLQKEKFDISEKDLSIEPSPAGDASNYDNQIYTVDPVSTNEMTDYDDTQRYSYPEQTEQNAASTTDVDAAVVDANVSQYDAVSTYQADGQDYQYTAADEQDYQSNDVDYQNYDPSQYQGEYDPNAYSYDYDTQSSSGVYADPNQQYSEDEAGYMQEQQQQQQQEYLDESYGAPEQYAAADYANYQEEAQEDSHQPAITAEEYQAAEEPQQEGDTSIDSSAKSTPVQQTKPTSILSTEKNSSAEKRKKRVNFVDSETDEGSVKPEPEGGVVGTSSESDFDFSSN